MPFKLPKLTTDIDCGPIGYPGLVVTCWLNVTAEQWEPPEKAEKWETLFYHGLARVFERFTFPPEMTDSGEAEVYEIPDARALYDLLNEPSFDQAIVIWAQSIYQDQRQARLEAELKN
jgi:hypothetical protein